MDALPVFYCPELAVSSGSRTSPSAEKPAAVVASWQKLGIPLVVKVPTPATIAQLSLAHDEAFVRGVLSRKRENGFGNRLARVARSLPLTSGAMLSAARHAMQHGGTAIAPVSGFHHAEYATAKGFCTFNGLAVTAAVLLSEGARRVGILDCDHHHGDGTEHILDQLELHDRVHHISVGERWFEPSHAPDFFARLPKLLEGFRDCDVVLYQAGADPHIDDPLGGWLTDTDLRERDATVFRTLYEQAVPVAWNLAGGYQRDEDGSIRRVLNIHDQTLRECAAVYLSTADAEVR
ncbi:MAG: acetoin utilization deacetylase AcuC-like enzyme [Myxococcota bacterium]|jgi:acetoin utilization deacetylase AcuC-like enzyme